MEPIKIERVGASDILSLQEVARKTFFQTFAGDNSEANMKDYLDERFSAERLGAELNDVNSEFYFATLRGEVVGYLKMNYGESQTELQDEGAVEIERIYVLREYQGKKVGQLLFGKALSVAQEMGAKYIWLGVWENNRKAIEFYRKNGFVEFGQHVFRLGNDDQTDILMKHIL